MIRAVWAPAGPFAAAERIDTWVFWTSVILPAAGLLGLGLWHLLGYLLRRRSSGRAVRLSPEPSRPAAPPPDDPERMQQACEALEGALSRRYLELGDAWARGGRPDKARASFQKARSLSPDAPAARQAEERLRQLGEAGPS
jgi:hypothetical protein